MNILMTGATGFVGRALMARLLKKEAWRVRCAVRVAEGHLPAGVEGTVVGDIGPGTRWERSLPGVDVVIHLAARVHVMRDSAAHPLTEFRRVNRDGTIRLARAAANAGVHRLVFISSVKVNGESTSPGRPFRESDAPAPTDPYGISKSEAEAALFALGAESGMEICVIRPTLVYGRGAGGNFRSLVQWLDWGVPLPLGSVRDNRRSLLGIGNLVDLITTCVHHPAAANQVFLAGDGEDMSTTQLIQRLAIAMGRPARLIPVPPGLLTAAARLLGRRDVAQRLLGSLQVDIAKAGRLLCWKPPISVDEGFRLAVSLS